MKKTILFLGLAMLLTGCGSSGATTQTDTESTTEITTDVVENTEQENEDKNIWETIEPVEIWGGNTVRMYFDNGNPNVMFEFQGNDVARQFYNFLAITNSISENYDTYFVSVLISDNGNGEKESGNIVYSNGNAIYETLPDSWTEFMTKNNIGNGEVTIGDFVSEDIQKADQQKLIEAINNATQQ